MWSWLARRALILLPTLIGASLISFTLIRLIPGDPVLHLLGERGGSEEQIAEMKQKLGLDKPLPQQYLIFVTNAVQGDMGTSTVARRPVE